MRKHINKLLKPFGFEFKKRSHTIRLLNRLFKQTDDFVFLQIGAHDGISFDDLYNFITSRSCSGYVVEPLPDLYESLKTNYLNFPKIIPINIGIHKEKEQINLHRVDPTKLNELPNWASGIASVFESHHLDSNIPSEFMQQEVVHCITLMQLINDNNIHKLDFMQVDVEGYDAEIIKMLDFKKLKPKLIKYEHQSLGKNDIDQLDKLLRVNGYKIIKERNDTLALLS